MSIKTWLSRIAASPVLSGGWTPESILKLIVPKSVQTVHTPQMYTTSLETYEISLLRVLFLDRSFQYDALHHINLGCSKAQWGILIITVVTCDRCKLRAIHSSSSSLEVKLKIPISVLVKEDSEISTAFLLNKSVFQK